jgi:HPt (histidine-containing phosphotransfer) domain-containing protein
MNSFRILLVEENSRRADDILAEPEKNQILAAVSTIAEAEEVLSIEKFDAILFRGQLSLLELAAFAGRLRKAENGITDRCRTVILVSGDGNDVAFADGCLPYEFTLDELCRTVSQVLERQLQQAGSSDSAPAQPAGFDPMEFAAQCANDIDLMVEIINLFLEECKIELPEMGEALGRRDFEALARLAHRMKGSLGSLHAPLARQRAQALESASKGQDHGVCSALLQALEHDLTALKEPLETLRDSCLRA